MSEKIKIVLLEDNEYEIKQFENYINKRDNIVLVGKTKFSDEAISLVKNFSPDVVILDLELHEGAGSGFEFINNLKNISLDINPLKIVTTNIASNIIYDKLHKDFVDLIFYKKQTDYSPKLVIESALLLLQTSEVKGKNNVKDTKEKDDKLCREINEELDLIGISYKLKGRDYIFDAVYYLLTNDNNDITVFQYLSNKYKLLTSSISRAIQTAINHTWRTTAIEDLRTHYTAQINYNTGVPTPTEFIYFLVKKIRN